MKGWLIRGALLGLPFFIFCASIDGNKEVKPFVMPLLKEELSRSNQRVETKVITIEDMDAFAKAVGEEKIKNRAYWRLEWDSGMYERGSFVFD